MKNTLVEALQYFEEANFSEQLEDIYAQIPEGTCSGCTKCCSEAVNTFFSEYINLRKQLEAQNELASFQKACLYYYLTELIQPMKCPLLRADGRCAVYFQRPLPCRVFGHLKREDYEANYSDILANNQEMAIQLNESLQIKVPESVISKKIDYCDSFYSPQPMSADDRDALVDELFYLDSLMLSRGLLDFEEINLSLVQWFAYDMLGKEEAARLRIQVSKELSKDGNSKSLSQIMEKF